MWTALTPSKLTYFITRSAVLIIFFIIVTFIMMFVLFYYHSYYYFTNFFHIKGRQWSVRPEDSAHETRRCWSYFYFYCFYFHIHVLNVFLLLFLLLLVFHQFGCYSKMSTIFISQVQLCALRAQTESGDFDPASSFDYKSVISCIIFFIIISHTNTSSTHFYPSQDKTLLHLFIVK